MGKSRSISWRGRAIKAKRELREAFSALERFGVKVWPKATLAKGVTRLAQNASEAVAAYESVNQQRAAFCADVATVLRAIEWQGPRGTCPNCHASKKRGHVGGCGLRMMLFRADGT